MPLIISEYRKPNNGVIECTGVNHTHQGYFEVNAVAFEKENDDLRMWCMTSSDHQGNPKELTGKDSWEDVYYWCADAICTALAKFIKKYKIKEAEL